MRFTDANEIKVAHVAEEDIEKLIDKIAEQICLGIETATKKFEQTCIYYTFPFSCQYNGITFNDNDQKIFEKYKDQIYSKIIEELKFANYKIQESSGDGPRRIKISWR